MEGEWGALVGLGGVPVVVALAGLARGLRLPAEWLPLAAVVLGVLWNVALAPLVPGGVYPKVLLGVLAGLAAAGLYDNGKAIVAMAGRGES